MGMSASQARLLTITARIHDVEYQAQAIQNAKIQLATQSDQVYQEYLDALDATTLTIKDYDGNRITATFNNLCGLNSVNSMYKYSLYDEKGRLIVPDDIYKGYNDFKKEFGMDDPYAFAMYMLDPDNSDKVKKFYDAEIAAQYNETVTSNLEGLAESSDRIYKIQQQMDELLATGGVDKYNGLSDKDREKYDQLEKQRNFLVYQEYAQVIYEGDETRDYIGGVDFDQDEFDYYANYYKQIQQANGCINISEYNGIANADASNDSEWLQSMVKSGRITIDTWTVDTKKTGDLTLVGTGVSSDSCLEYTATSTIDKSALAKAEAKYEHDTKQIDQKDKRFDNELSKLETEREALTTEYDSVKKVIQDNIERTFGIFS